MSEEKTREVRFEITEHLGELSISSSGKIKEVNMVKWNDRPAKYDIREWEPSHEWMGRGVTMTAEEVIKLREILNELNL